MPATFNRVKDWVTEVLTAADLNAEIDNILSNLGPAGIGDYASDVTEYRTATSPVTGAGAPSLPNSLAGEIERLRYQIQAIMGVDADYWYDSPSATLSGLSTIVFGNSVPLSRVESIGSDSYVNLLEPSGSTTSVTLKGATNTIVYYVNGVRYELDEDIAISGMSAASASTNTATFNDASVSGLHASTYSGEHDTVMTLASVGASITAQAAKYQAYKVVRGGATEYFTGYYNTTGTKIEKARRGCFFTDLTTPSSRTTIINADTITLQKISWIFLKNDSTLSLTYNVPVYSFTQPSSPAIGDYWFDMDSTTWKVYGSLGYEESDSVLIGQAITSSTACVAARSVEPYRVYSTQNVMNIEVDSATTALKPKELQSSLSIYGTTHYWGASTALWNAAALEVAGSLSASTTYYAYVKETAEFVLSTYAPNDRRGDLGGYYHPSEGWRCVGYCTTDGSSLFTSTSLISFFLSGEKAFFSNLTDEELVVSTAMLQANSVTQAKRAALGQQVSSSSGTDSINSTTADIDNLSVTITTTGRPVFIGLVSDGSANDARFLVTRTANSASATIQLLEGSTVLSRQVYSMVAVGATTATLTIPPSCFWHIYQPSAGTYTYKAVGTTSASIINADYIKLVAYEL